MAGVMVRDGIQRSPFCEALKDVGLNVEVIGKCDSCVDVLIGNDRAVQFIDIAELGEREGVVDTYKDRVRLLTKDFPNAIVVVIHQATDWKCFYNLQEVIAIDCELTLISVEDHNKAAKYVKQLCDCTASNVSSHQSSVSSTHPIISQAVQCLPKTGKVKSQNLLENFKSIYGIANASQEELKAVVGASNASAIHSFLHNPFNIK